MKCDEIREKISSMLDNELSAEDSAIVTEHITTCPECMNIFEAFHAISLSLETLEDEPEGFTEAVMERIHETTAVRKRRPVLKLFASLAACVAIVLLAGPQMNLFPAVRGGGNAEDASAYTMRTAPTAEQTADQATNDTITPTQTPATDAMTFGVSMASLDEDEVAEEEATESLKISMARPKQPDLSVLLTATEAAEYGLYTGDPQYTVMVEVPDAAPVKLMVWFEDGRVYCMNPTDSTAYYVVLEAEKLAALQSTVEALFSPVSDTEEAVENDTVAEAE